MHTFLDPFSFLVVSLSGWMNQHQQHVIHYLIEVLGPGASVLGHIVAEPGTSLRTPIGLRVSTTTGPDQYLASKSITAPVAGV